MNRSTLSTKAMLVSCNFYFVALYLCCFFENGKQLFEGDGFFTNLDPTHRYPVITKWAFLLLFRGLHPCVKLENVLITFQK